MADNVSKDIGASITRFLQWCPRREFEFPLGGSIDIPADEELVLVDVLRGPRKITSDDVLSVREHVTPDDSYSLVIFGVRMSVLAVRVSDPSFLRAGLLGMMIHSADVDWRELLIALALVEHCALSLKVSFQEQVLRASELAVDDVQDTVRAYLSRTSEMREIGVMGYYALGQGASFGFARL